MKIFLTGASGILGLSVLRLFQSNGNQVDFLKHREIFKYNYKDFKNYLTQFDLVIHAAANTNIEECEIDPDSCYRDNTLLTEIIASACKSIKLKMIFISSTGVYGDYQDSAYREYSSTRPTNHHHKSKLLAEKIVQSYSTDNLIVRVGWLFGGELDNPRNFVFQRLKEAKECSIKQEKLYSNNEQIGCPTYTEDVANKLLMFINEGQSGIYNIVNEGLASRYEYVNEIIKLSSYSISVEPSSAVIFNRKAKVSNNETALNWRLNEMGFSKMPHWKDSLKIYISKIYR